MGEAPRPHASWSRTADDVERLDLPADAKLAYLTQTTLSVDDANVIIARPAAEVPADRRPAQGRHLLRDPEPPGGGHASWRREADVVLVLGSQNSSNSQRLAEIASGLGPHGAPDRRRRGDPADEWFDGVETVLITAGASAPEDVVQECVEYLQRRFGATVEEESVREEHVNFPLPKSLRELLPVAAASDDQD